MPLLLLSPTYGRGGDNVWAIDARTAPGSTRRPDLRRATIFCAIDVVTIIDCNRARRGSMPCGRVRALEE
jgi:hypothetical protein